MPASPGSVSVASTIERPPDREEDIEGKRRDGEHAAQPVVPHHDQDDEQRAHQTRREPFADRVAAEAGADLPLLDDLERDRQRAGLERERQVLRLLELLLPSVIWPLRPIRLWMIGGRPCTRPSSRMAM